MTENSPCRHLIVDTQTESAAEAADFAELSTMAWNHCPRSRNTQIKGFSFIMRPI
jgi:hypothetical protein